VEKLFFQKNVKTGISVGQGRGAALIAAAESNTPVGEYNPLEIKQAVVGFGNADKEQVQQMVKVLLQMNDIPKPDDAADALAVAICHLHTTRRNHIINYD
jgi:crossover junction endodeoxyribonuclease RuvC